MVVRLVVVVGRVVVVASVVGASVVVVFSSVAVLSGGTMMVVDSVGTGTASVAVVPVGDYYNINTKHYI